MTRRSARIALAAIISAAAIPAFLFFSSLSPLAHGSPEQPTGGLVDRVPIPTEAPDWTPAPWQPPSGVRTIGSCLVPADASEVFPSAAAANRSQRVFDSPTMRIFALADGSCVDLIKGPGVPVPDFVPDNITPVDPREDIKPEAR